MDYNHITIFLDKFKKLIYQKEETKEIVIKVIGDEIHHPIDNKAVKIRDGYIYIKSSPIVCNEVFIHKNQILTKLKDLLPNNNFLNIR
jgi:hypothetical protein